MRGGFSVGGLEGLDDNELCALCRKGDENAFRELSSRCYLLLKKNASGFGCGGPEQDDLFQEGLIALHDAAVSYDGNAGASFRTYAGVCVRNRMISAVRHHQSVKKHSPDADASIEEAERVPSPPDTDPLNIVIMGEELKELEAFLRDSLSESESRVLDLYVGGLSYDEIAVRLGMTKKACDNAMQRVRRKLRRLRR